MKKFKTVLLFLILCIQYYGVGAQGTLPIYSDYLSDNVYLVHPAAAGIGNDGKLRFTHRQQWSGNTDAPSLQTISLHNKFGNKVALGLILFNDKNGFHSQVGVQGTYAYHVNFGRDDALNQISFALSATYAQNKADQRSFSIPDPVISRIVESDSYFNADFGMAYHNLDGYAFFTVKNLLLNTRSAITAENRSINLRKYLLNVGYFFGWGKRFQIEPSMMFQFAERTEEITIDANVKVYKILHKNKRIWMAASYRRSFDNNKIQELSQITPIIGLELDRYFFSYTYTQQLGDFVFQNGGYHQFTLGLNVFRKRPKDRGYIPRFNRFIYKNDN
ncbi:MAG TPA: type IX secretion system membrane protein PorP/SprF [Flavobacteriia bacterium]|nr:type IX secretion system membrane protein PorP/SprF [Flavobacteriia bacterium]